MDVTEDMGEDEQVVVEEVVEEGEPYYDEETAYYDEAEAIDVVDELEPGEYIQLETGEYVRAPVEHQNLAQRSLQQRPPPQLQRQAVARRPDGTPVQAQVYHIKNNQAYRVDKNDHGVQLKPVVKQIKSDPDNIPGGSTMGMVRNSYAAIPFRSTAGGTYNQFPPTLSAQIVKPKRLQRKIMTGNRKPCNCTKSQCLKLYCECFANGEFCKDCNCKDCHNNLTFESERSKAIRSSLERNPNAFKPKIVSGGAKGKSDIERLHMKGCHCKKSNCLKNYCECYEAKVACTERCKCCGCKNTESDRASKFRERMGPTALLSLATVASMTDSHEHPPYSDDESDGESDEKADPKTMPWFYLTDDVIEASTLCLMTTADDLETHQEEVSDEYMERQLMGEFSMILTGVINLAKQSRKEAQERHLAAIAAKLEAKPSLMIAKSETGEMSSETPSTPAIDDESSRQSLGDAVLA